MIQEKQNKFYEQLEQLESEHLLRAFINWNGTQLLTDEFLEFCIEEGYIYSDDIEDTEDTE